MAVSKLVQTLPVLISLFFMLAKAVHSEDTSFAFDSFSKYPTNLKYQGDAHVPSETKFLRLTKTDTSGTPGGLSVGRVLYSSPVKLWDESSGKQANFETTIKFLITPSENDAADGIAFFIAPVNTNIPSGSDGGNFGIFDSSGTSGPLFAVEFDTYQNDWDPIGRHIGIDFYSRISCNVTKFDSASKQVVTATIKYVANTGTISVVASTCTQSSQLLTYVYKLRNILPEQVKVGISSATGPTVSYDGVHDIHSWHFTSTLVSVSANVNNNIKNEEAYIRKYMSM